MIRTLPQRHAALAGYLEAPALGIDDAGVVLPLADEPHVATWQAYADSAGSAAAADVLLRELPQVSFPVAAGVGASDAYRAATRRLDAPRPLLPPPFVDPAGIRIDLQSTAAGRVPVVSCRARADFERLVRSLGARNEPVAVPPSMGASIVAGMVNIGRVAAHRDAWLAAGHDSADWDAEYRRFTADKANYQDRVILLSDGPYAGVAAARLGLDASDWLQRSRVLRRVHECTHYLTARLLGSMRNSLLDELAADYAGIVAAFGRYDAAVARIVLGVDQPSPSVDARLRLYLGDPPLDEASVPLLAALANEAIDVLASFDAESTPAARPHGVERLVLALFRMPLHALVDDGGLAQLQQHWQDSLDGA